MTTIKLPSLSNMEVWHSWLLLTGSLLLCELNKISILRTRAGRVLPSRQKLPKTALHGSFASIFSCLAPSGLQKVARIAKLPLLQNIHIKKSGNSCLRYAKGYHWCFGRFKHAPRPHQGLPSKSATDGGFSKIESTDVDLACQSPTKEGGQSADED